MFIGIGMNMVRSGGGARPFPLSLAPLAWHDPSDLSTLFQNADGTGAVTADSDPVKRVLDKSGNGHFVSSATGQLYRTDGSKHWIQFDGVDDYLASTAAALRITGDLTLVLGVHKVDAAAFGMFVSCQTNAATVNQYEFRTDNIAGTPRALTFVAADTAMETEVGTGGNGVINQATDAVVTLTRRSGIDVVITCNENGVANSLTAAHTKVPTSDTNSEFRLGSRKGSAIFLNGRIYQSFVFNKLLTAGEMTAMKSFVAGKMGFAI